MQNNAKIWDPLVRIFHWTVAAGFLANYFLLEEGEEPHELMGYYILAAVTIRILWGFIGPQSARFSDFFPTPSRLRHHLNAIRSGKSDHPDGHNPVGGLMVLALLALLIATGVSGWMQGLDLFWGEDWVEELHEVAAYLTLLLVIVHVSAVLLFSLFGPRNLVRQMITGKRELRRGSTT